MYEILSKLFSKQTKTTPIPETECFICLEKCDKKYTDWKKGCKCKVFCCDDCKKEYKEKKEFSCPICRKKRIKKPETDDVVIVINNSTRVPDLPSNEEMLREVYRRRRRRTDEDLLDEDEDGCCLSCINCITDGRFWKGLCKYLFIIVIFVLIFTIP